MDKSEKINKIKESQILIASNVKARKLDEALGNINELLNLAPNLVKIQELKAKLETQIEKDKKDAPVIPNEDTQKTPEKSAEKEPEKQETFSAAESVPKESEEKKENTGAEEKLTENLTKKEEDELLEELLEQNGQGDSNEDDEKNEDGRTADDSASSNEQVAFEEELSFNVGKDELLTPEAVEAKLHQLLQLEKEQHNQKEGTPETDLADILDNTGVDDSPDEPANISEKQIEDDSQVELEDFDVEHLISKNETEPLPTIKAKLDVDTKVVTPVLVEEVAKKEEKAVENKLNEEKLAKDQKLLSPELTGKKTEFKIQDSDNQTEAGEKTFTMKNDSEVQQKSKVAPETEKKKFTLPKEPLEKQAAHPFSVPKKLSSDNLSQPEKEEDLTSLHKEKKPVTNFKISETVGMKPEPLSETEFSAVSVDLDSKMGEFKREGFHLRNIAQAIGFVFNMERLLYSTGGLMFIIVISKILLSILPASSTMITTPIVSLMLIMILSTFIAFTVIKQIDQKTRSDFKFLIPEFNRDLLIPSALFWVFWMALIGILIAILAIITVIGNFDSFGALIYSVLSPVNFLLTLIVISLLLASGLISFITPAIIAVGKPGLFTMLKEVLFTLKNHLFTVLGGFLLNLLLNTFVMIITLIALMGTYSVTLLSLLEINPGYLVKFIASLPATLQMMIMSISPDISNLLAAGASLQPTGTIETIGFYLFIITMTTGSLFLISIPFIFQNAAAVITYLTVMNTPEILEKN